MIVLKRTFTFLACLIVAVMSNPQGPSLLPLLGFSCGRCPQHYCDDDQYIIAGYCCGCARYADRLPVKCTSSLRCPYNTYELCENYEYMIRCCCATS